MAKAMARVFVVKIRAREIKVDGAKATLGALAAKTKVKAKTMVKAMIKVVGAKLAVKTMA